MRKAFLISLLVASLICLFTGLASARWVSTFVEGKIFVELGQHKTQVEYVCGKPLSIEKQFITKGRAQRRGDIGRGSYNEYEQSFQLTIPLETWTYTDKILYFENGFLQAIWK